MEAMDSQPDFGLRLLLAESEIEREEMENLLIEMDIEAGNEMSYSDISNEEICVKSEPPISLDSVKCVTASPGPLLRKKLDDEILESIDELDRTLQKFDDIPFIDDENGNMETTQEQSLSSAFDRTQTFEEEITDLNDQNRNMENTVTADTENIDISTIPTNVHYKMNYATQDMPFMDDENDNTDSVEMDNSASLYEDDKTQKAITDSPEPPDASRQGDSPDQEQNTNE